MRQNSEISYLSLSKKLLHPFCVRLRVFVPSVSIALAETVLSAQAVHNPQIAQLHKLCMLIFQKLAVTQALRVKSPKVSTVWEKKNTSMLAMLGAFCISVYTIITLNTHKHN